MATITLRAGQGAIRDMTRIDWSAILGLPHSQRSATSLRLYDGASGQALIAGRAFSYGGVGPGGLRAGTLQDLRISRAGVTVFEATGLAFSAVALAAAYSRSDDGAFTRLLMAGNDLLRGTDLAETLTGYAGTDTVHGMGGNHKIFGGNGKSTRLDSDVCSSIVRSRTSAISAAK